MTQNLSNPDFTNETLINSAPFGWILETSYPIQSKISTAGKGDELISSNQGHWQLWSASGGMRAKAYQIVKNIPNGKYTVSAVICTSATDLLYLFGGNNFVNVTGNGIFQTTAVVYDGTLQLGLQINTDDNEIVIDFDNFHLYYYGEDLKLYSNTLRQRIDIANEIIAHPQLQVDMVFLINAVNKAKEILEHSSDNADELCGALSEMNIAIEKYNTLISNHNMLQDLLSELNNAITVAEQYLNSHDYVGREAFKEMIQAAKSFVSNCTTHSAEEFSKMIYQLNKAKSDYYASQFIEDAISQTISYVDFSLSESEKFTLKVDEKPFYLTNVQVRFDKLYGYKGWTDQEMELVAEQASKDGFNTISIPIHWREVEPEKDHFDWQVLDKYMGWCQKYGMHMELLWFSWSSGGRVQNLWNFGGKKELRTPDYVCSLEGTSEYNVLKNTADFTLDWHDENLREREVYVVSQIMEHIAKWEAHNKQPHVVIGMQLGNEARSYHDNSATAADIIEYYSAVGSAVKQSKYKIWTRLNCVYGDTKGRINANENKRNNGGTNIDFVGIDVYGTNASAVMNDFGGNLPEERKNFRMIMEINALDTNSPLYQMAAIAGNKAFDYYNYCVVDGNAMYSDSAHTIVERSHVSLVRQRNKILNMANQDIALKRQGFSLYVYNPSGNSNVSEVGLAGISFTPLAPTTQALAIHHSKTEILLLSTDAGVFNIPDNIEVTEVSFGYTDTNNQWIAIKGSKIENENQIVFSEAGCIRICFVQDSEHSKDPVNSNSFVLNGDFEYNDAILDNAPYGWTTTLSNVTTSKISVLAKGDGSVIKDNENHWQIWHNGIVYGKICQVITDLPNGSYTLSAGIYSTFQGKVQLYAACKTTDVVSGANEYYTVDFYSSGEDVEIGLLLDTDGIVDIEFDHVTLALKDSESNISAPKYCETSQLGAEIYNLKGNKIASFSGNNKGLYIIKNVRGTKKVLINK